MAKSSSFFWLRGENEIVSASYEIMMMRHVIKMGNGSPNMSFDALLYNIEAEKNCFTRLNDAFLHIVHTPSRSRSIYVLAAISLANHYHNITGKGFILTETVTRDILVSTCQSFSCKGCVCYPKREQ